jgi:hypothetical protein
MVNMTFEKKKNLRQWYDTGPRAGAFNFSFNLNFSARLRRMKKQTIDGKGIAVHFQNGITNHFYRKKKTMPS